MVLTKDVHILTSETVNILLSCQELWRNDSIKILRWGDCLALTDEFNSIAISLIRERVRRFIV